MNILLTNDDGINAAGINSLYNAFSRHHAVYVIAPDLEQSACSNAITVRTPLTIKKVSENRFSVSGFPADCVIIGLSSDFIPAIDLVISGINHGPNVGDDLFFSGTVAGARTGYIFGTAAVSVSMNCSKKRPSKYFDDASKLLLDFIHELAPGGSFSPKAAMPFFNINYPDLPSGEIKGRKYTYIGRRIYRDCFHKSVLHADETDVQMGGYIESISAEGSDSTELEKGYISITPLMLDCTDYSCLRKKTPGPVNG